MVKHLEPEKATTNPSKKQEKSTQKRPVEGKVNSSISVATPQKKSFLQSFYDRPIGQKQFIIATAGIFSVLALVIIEGLIIHNYYEEVDLLALIRQNLPVELFLLAIVTSFNLLLAFVLGQTIVNPIEDLQKTAQAFNSGKRDVRAKVFAGDEVGQLAKTFNQLAENTVRSELAIAQEAQQLEKARQDAVNVVLILLVKFPILYKKLLIWLNNYKSL